MLHTHLLAVKEGLLQSCVTDSDDGSSPLRDQCAVAHPGSHAGSVRYFSAPPNHILYPICYLAFGVRIRFQNAPFEYVATDQPVQ